MPELMRLVDSADISDDDIIYRRTRWIMLGGADAQKDGKDLYPLGEVAPKSKNFFSDYPEAAAIEKGFEGPCMSVGLRSRLIAEGAKPSDILTNYPEDGLLYLTVGDLRRLTTGSGKSCPQGVMRASTPDEPWHAVVFNLGGPPRSKPAKDAMAVLADWEIEMRR